VRRVATMMWIEHYEVFHDAEPSEFGRYEAPRGPTTFAT